MTGDDRHPHGGHWTWLVTPAEPDAPVEDWPSGAGTFRGILFAVPLSGLLWWGIVALWQAFA
ncbi:hypothetical protein [Novosphingobium sp.]|uniref:hypothetical protein n=1 Tax=Novosphingobium sp. TaxID=1874826 RepID=UPI00260D6665|nr:hypothetical protein [Novosphingobium sp.]